MSAPVRVQVKVAGPPGRNGSSGIPGGTYGQPDVDDDGELGFDAETVWGIDAEGVPYYEPDPDDVAADERAVLTPWDMTLSLEGAPSPILEQTARRDQPGGYAGLDDDGLLRLSEFPDIPRDALDASTRASLEKADT